MYIFGGHKNWTILGGGIIFVYFRVFCLRARYRFTKFQIFLGMPNIPDIFGG